MNIHEGETVVWIVIGSLLKVQLVRIKQHIVSERLFFSLWKMIVFLSETTCTVSVSRWTLSMVNIGSGAHGIMITTTTTTIVIVCVCTRLHVCLSVCVFTHTHAMVVSGRVCEAAFFFPLYMGSGGSGGSGSQDDSIIIARKQ